MTLAAIKFYKDEGAKQQVSEGFVRRFQSLGKSLKNVKSLGKTDGSNDAFDDSILSEA